MRRARVFYKKELAGMLLQNEDGSFVFSYIDSWIENSAKPAISLTLPKSKQEYESKYLFPFFFNLLPEGTNKQVVCREMRIDANDYFGLLTTTAKFDVIGAVTIENIKD